MTNQPKQKTPLTTETQVNREKCSCGVPHDVHGTCCGWNNASACLNELGIIIDSEHPFFQKTINEWINGHNTISLTAETEHKQKHQQKTSLTKFKKEIAEHLGISYKVGLAHFINAINKIKKN